jgi:hypothetical protein
MSAGSMSEQHFNALPAGHVLQEYTVRSVLGHGGFGITYLAFDNNLGKEVAIKEYLPAEFAVRQGAETVRPRSTADNDDYQWGLDRFVGEAQTLARFKHPSIVPVYRFFKANGTAYMVMEYQSGESLATLMRKFRGEFTEEDLLNLTLPVLDGLSEVHRTGFLHRDLKPGNIFIRADGTPVLLDFGAARSAVGRKSKNLTSIVTPGYAPLEQYFADGNQGPWTDIYALGAILYQAVSGRIPPEAPARVKKDPIQPAAQIGKGKFSARFLAAIDRALMVEEEARPQSVEAWRAMMVGQPADAAEAPSTKIEATMLAGGTGGGAGAAARKAAPGSSGVATSMPPAVGAAASAAAAGEGGRRRGLPVAVLASAGVLLLGLTGAGAMYVFKPDLGGLFGGRSTASTTEPGRDPRTGPETADPARRQQEEEARRAEEARRQEEARRREEEARRQEEARRREEEAKRQEEARRREEEARRQEEARRREEEARRQEETRRQEEARRAEEERRRQEEARRQEEERRAAEEKRKQEEAAKAEEERKRAEEARRREEEKKREEANRPTGGVTCPYSVPALNGAYASATDCFYVQQVFRNALTTGNANSTSRWRNSNTGNSGTLTVHETRETGGVMCRAFTQTVTTAQGVTRTGRGTACFRNGQWQIVA